MVQRFGGGEKQGTRGQHCVARAELAELETTWPTGRLADWLQGADTAACLPEATVYRMTVEGVELSRLAVFMP